MQERDDEEEEEETLMLNTDGEKITNIPQIQFKENHYKDLTRVYIKPTCVKRLVVSKLTPSSLHHKQTEM